MKKIITAFAIGMMYAAMTSCGHIQQFDNEPSKYLVCDDGSRVHYKVVGEGEPTVVFVHGLGCDMRTWFKQYDALASDSVKQVYVDLPGFGKSDRVD